MLFAGLHRTEEAGEQPQGVSWGDFFLVVLF